MPSTQSSSGCVQPFSSVGVRVHEREHDETGDQRERRLEDLNAEVDAVLELVQHAERRRAS